MSLSSLPKTDVRKLTGLPKAAKELFAREEISLILSAWGVAECCFALSLVCSFPFQYLQPHLCSQLGMEMTAVTSLESLSRGSVDADAVLCGACQYCMRAFGLQVHSPFSFVCVVGTGSRRLGNRLSLLHIWRQ